MPGRTSGTRPKGSGIPAGGPGWGGPAKGAGGPNFLPGNAGMVGPDHGDRIAGGLAARKLIIAAAEEAARLKIAEMHHENPFIASKARSEILERSVPDANAVLAASGKRAEEMTDDELAAIASGGIGAPATAPGGTGKPN